MGRKKKPSHLKKIEGSYRKDRDDNPDKPDIEPILPEPPKWLNESGKKAYRNLKEDLECMGVASKEDAHMLSIVCQAYGELMKLNEFLNKNGMTYETTDTKGNTTVKKYPEAELASDKEKFVSSKLTEFGLSPASREKVSKVATNEGESGLSKLLNGENID